MTVVLIQSLKSRSSGISAIETAILEVVSSSVREAQTLTFAEISVQMKSQVAVASGEIVLDEGSGKDFAETVTAAMDNYLELAALAFLMNNGGEQDNISSEFVNGRVKDVELILRQLSEFWGTFLRMSLVELIDPMSAAGQEQTLSLEKLKMEQLTSAMDNEESLSDEKKARIRVARERNIVIAAAVDVCFQALLCATRDLLELRERLTIEIGSQALSDLLPMITTASTIITDIAEAANISAVEAESMQPHEQLRRMALQPSLTLGGPTGDGDELNYTCFDGEKSLYSFHGSSTPLGVGYTAHIAPFLRCTALGRTCVYNHGEERHLWMQSIMSKVAVLFINSQSNGGAGEETVRSSIFVSLAKFEHSLTGEGSESEKAESNRKGTYRRMRRHGRMRAIYAVIAQSYLVALLGIPLRSLVGAFTTTNGAMMATAAPLCLRMIGESVDSLKCLGTLLLKTLLDACPSGLLLSAQNWLLPEVYRQWELCEEITRHHQESGFKRGLIEGKIDPKDCMRMKERQASHSAAATEERRHLYMASLLLSRLTQGLLSCTTAASSKGHAAFQYHYRYIDSLLHKIRLHVASPAAVWCYLSQASAYLCHHHHYPHFPCPHAAVSQMAEDPLSKPAHDAYIAARLEHLAVCVSRGVRTPNDTSLFLVSTMAGTISDSVVGVLHDCSHAAVHYECLRWLGLVMIALASHSIKDNNNEPPGVSSHGHELQTEAEEIRTKKGIKRGKLSAAEAQVHLVTVSELLRLLIFYHSEAQDLWLSLPEPGEEEETAREKNLRRGLVVAEAGALLAFILARSPNTSDPGDEDGTQDIAASKDLRKSLQVMAASVKGSWAGPRNGNKQPSSSLLERLPPILWE